MLGVEQPGLGGGEMKVLGVNSSSLDLEEMPVERLEGWGVVRRLRWKNR